MYLSSYWQAPLLRGVVQEGSSSYRAGLIIKSASDAENFCPCRQSRQYGMICAHSVAVGLHYLKSQAPAAPAPGLATASPSAGPKRAMAASTSKPAGKALRRSGEGETGEPLEVSVILPPNFIQAAAKGRIMLCLEGKWRNGHSPLNALPLSTPFSLSKQDAALLDFLETLNGGDTPAMAILNLNQFTQALSILVGHPRVTLGKAQELEISEEELAVNIRASLEDNGEIVLRPAAALPSGLIRATKTWIFKEAKLQPLGLPAGLEDLLNGALRVPRSRVPQFLNFDWPKLAASGALEADFSLEDFSLEPANPRFKLHLAGGLAVLQAKLDCFYGEKRVTPGVAGGGEDALWLADPQSPTRYSTRNFAAEQIALGRLLRYGFSLPDAQGLSKVANQNLILKFFAREFPQLEKEWPVTLEERLERSTQQNLERIEPRFQITPFGRAMV